MLRRSSRLAGSMTEAEADETAVVGAAVVVLALAGGSLETELLSMSFLAGDLAGAVDVATTGTTFSGDFAPLGCCCGTGILSSARRKFLGTSAAGRKE